MSKLEKLADSFEKEVNDGDIFGNVSYHEDSKHLKLLAGKIYYKSEKEPDKMKAAKLKDISSAILRASEMLKTL